MGGAFAPWRPSGRKARTQLAIIDPGGLLLQAPLSPDLGGPGVCDMLQLAGLAAGPDGRQPLLLALLPLAHPAVALQVLLHHLGQPLL